ncbi:MAG: NAD(P)/FAD-dependent oxidoreductase [Planctomycetota bacterium]|nr:NAD(P)/FAD-dependent oxidoreductase [Planctomycetota bacterium]
MGANKKHILILGGGFGGLYAAFELERQLGKDPDIQITLVNRDNFFLFTPMLHEIAASDVEITTIVNPVRKLLKRINFFAGDVESIDVPSKKVVVSHGLDRHTHELAYDYLVLSLGSITNFFGLPGLEERALTMKSLGDAIHLRNRMIQHLEEADPECAVGNREPLLTFVVAGGGFAGVETIAGMNDFLREAIPHYNNLNQKMVRLVLVHPGPYILPELGEDLGRYTEGVLRGRGIDIRVNTKVTACGPEGVTLTDGTLIKGCTLVWTAGTSPNPLIAKLPVAKEKGRIKANEFLEAEGAENIWALGDCAMVPDPATKSFHPPTAQHALREGLVAARNVIAAIKGGRKQPFRFKTLGLLASIGKRRGVAKIFGLKFSGFFAWWLWRSIYLSKLPGFEKKVRVALAWTLDLLFSKDTVQFMTFRAPTVSHEPTHGAHGHAAAAAPGHAHKAEACAVPAR